jgi:hypothetical protein
MNTCSNIILAAALSCVATGVQAQSTSDWQYRVTPYLWAAGIDGQSGLAGFPPQPLKLSFGDILDNLEMSVALVGEARKNAVSFSFDLFYVDLKTDVTTPNGAIADSIGISSTTIFGSFMAGYTVFDTQDTVVDVVGGARLWDVKTTFTLNGGPKAGDRAGDGDTWADPLIGVKFRHSLTSEWYLAGWALVGGFGVASDSLWDVMAGIGYEFNDRISGFAGYRAMSVDYSEDGFVWDVTQKGPIIGAVIKF